MTKPGINVTLNTTRALGKTQVCEYVPGKSIKNQPVISSEVKSGELGYSYKERTGKIGKK